MTESQQLLADYVATGSEEAFRELVARYVDLVYSTALRLVEGDPHRAKDVAQTVFVDLARQAANLSANSMLGGWLHRHTCFVARTVMRGERRRQARERQAVEMSALDNLPDTALAEIAPVLDEAINELGADDRDAVLLRFFERRNLRSVGEALGISENVAQKRVARALQELAVLLKHRGVSLPVAVLASGLAAGAVKAAPAGLAMGLAQAALASSSAAGGMAAISTETVIATKLKIGVACALIIGGAATTFWLQHSAGRKQSREQPLSASQLTEQPAGETEIPPTPPPVSQPTISAPLAAAPRSEVEPRTRATEFSGVVAEAPSQIVRAPRMNAPGVAPIQRFVGASGSRVRIEGTFDFKRRRWQAESREIGGFLEIEQDAIKSRRPGEVRARAEVFVPILSIKTGDKDGRPWSDQIDQAWYTAFRAKGNPTAKIWFYLSALTLREGDMTNGGAPTFEASGDLVLVGATNHLTMPVQILPLEGGRLFVSGATSIEWVSEEVDPFAIPTELGTFNPGPAVAIRFEWLVASKNAPQSAPQKGLVPLYLDLPAPTFKEIPRDLRLGPDVEHPSDMPRPPLLVPPGLKNLAPDTGITCSDSYATAEALAKIVDGNKGGADESIVYLRKGTQWVQLDFGGSREIFAIAIWHAHNAAKVFHDVVVQVADNAEFRFNVRTLFNNDRDNSSGLGKGADREYLETYEGKLIDAKGVRGRFLRFYSRGSTESALNEYTEIEVYGREAQ
ncbi:MAG TPA: sigma-70 family RNA polymerase sigma factor [Verrucomicrobiae bacterium]